VPGRHDNNDSIEFRFFNFRQIHDSLLRTDSALSPNSDRTFPNAERHSG
jgi:hypothetical protein